VTVVNDNLQGDIATLAKPLRKLLDLSSLKELHFKFESARNIKTLVKTILEGNKEVKDKVKIIKKDGSLAPHS
jgi:hypothetical protein